MYNNNACMYPYLRMLPVCYIRMTCEYKGKKCFALPCAKWNDSLRLHFETLLKFVINTSLHGFLKLHFSTLFKKIEKAFKCFRMLLTWQSYASVILRCSRPTHSSKPFVQSVYSLYRRFRGSATQASIRMLPACIPM